SSSSSSCGTSRAFERRSSGSTSATDASSLSSNCCAISSPRARATRRSASVVASLGSSSRGSATSTRRSRRRSRCSATSRSDAAEPGTRAADAFELIEHVMKAAAKQPATSDAQRADRQRAGALLKERYRADGRSADLVRVLEVELDGVSDPAERARRLREIIQLRLEQLGDEAGALEGVAALVLLEPS